MKQELQAEDVLILKNGKRVILSERNKYLLVEFYDDELNCMTNPEYSIIQVLRPVYEPIFERESKRL